MASAVSSVQEEVFYMLGIIHRDNENGAVIGNWLNRMRPHIVTLEFSRYGLAFRRGKGRIYRSRIESLLIRMRQNGQTVSEEALSFLRAYIDLPAEYEAASHYCDQTGASLHLVDADIFSRRRLKDTDELFSEDNMRNLMAARGHHAERSERVMARLFFDAGIQTSPYTDEMHIRDKYMSNKIHALMKSHKGERITHITGWQHLRDPYNIFTPLHPVKVFPYD